MKKTHYKNGLTDEIIDRIVELESDNRRLKELYKSAESLLASIASILELQRQPKDRL